MGDMKWVTWNILQNFLIFQFFFFEKSCFAIKIEDFQKVNFMRFADVLYLHS